MEDNVKLTRLQGKDKSVLQNLFQLYLHDITASLPMDVNEHGLFEYNYLDLYFLEQKNRYAYFIHINNQLAGFVLIDDEFMVLDKEIEDKYDLSELFLLNAYKRKGYGEIVAKKLFDMYRGSWEIRAVPRSEGANKFWIKVVKDYTNNNFLINYPKPNRIVLTFKNDD